MILEVVYDHVGKCRKLALCYFIQIILSAHHLEIGKQKVTWLKPKNYVVDWEKRVVKICNKLQKCKCEECFVFLLSSVYIRYTRGTLSRILLSNDEYPHEMKLIIIKTGVPSLLDVFLFWSTQSATLHTYAVLLFHTILSFHGFPFGFRARLAIKRQKYCHCFFIC